MEKLSSENKVDQIPKRLKLEGLTRYGRIPYKVAFTLECPTNSKVDEKNPGWHAITPDLGRPDYSLYIMLHESIPSEYRDIVAYHELEESEMMHVDGIEVHEAHQQAIAKTTEYARSCLSKEEFEKFLEWQKTLDNY